MKNPSKGKSVDDIRFIRELPSESRSFRHSFPEYWLIDLLTDWLIAFIYLLVDLFIYLFAGSRNARV